MTGPGVHKLLASSYHAGKGVSKSQLDLIHECPALLEWAREAPVDDGAQSAVQIGTAFHTLLLEPERFNIEYVLDFKPPANAICTVEELKAGLIARGIEFKASASKSVLTKMLLDEDPNAPVADAMEAEWRRGLDGRIVLSSAEGLMLSLMQDSVMAHPYARRLIEMPGEVEQSHFWNDLETGELCRCRPDKSVSAMGIVVDVKTTPEAGAHAFSKSVKDYRYYVQDAYYRDGYSATVQPCKGFLFLAVNTKRDRARYPVHVYSLPPEQVEMGRQEYRADLAVYAQCRKSGKWPGVEALSLPDWFLRQQLAA